MLKKETRRAGANIFNYELQKDISQYRPEQENRVKTEICRNWEAGLCEYGEKCVFAHGQQELREKSNSRITKDQKCEKFFKFGYCISGSKCQFNHSEENSESRLSPFSKSPKIGLPEKIIPPVFIDLESRTI
jgi:hypothetical protein